MIVENKINKINMICFQKKRKKILRDDVQLYPPFVEIRGVSFASSQMMQHNTPKSDKYVDSFREIVK